nr:agmatine deiminase family protein [Idiomarina rhizosphaerae]
MENQRLLLAWPYRGDVWRKQAGPARDALIKLIKQLPDNTPVSLVVPASISDSVPEALKSVQRIEIDYDDIWLRDTAPLWQLNSDGQLAALSFDFDGWGGVQDVIATDKIFAKRLCSRLRRPVVSSQLIAEGGAFTHNGQGDWLIGLACIKQRNPKMTEREIKSLLDKLLPGQRLHFFDGALVADETGGHIDNMALFVDANTLLYAATDSTAHPDYKTCQALKRQLDKLPAYIRTIPLPLPLPQMPACEEREEVELTSSSLKRTVELPLLCSYVNVLQTSRFVAVPQFGLSTDADALLTIREALPQRKVIAVDAREFVLGGGGLHCISHNLPEFKADEL